MTTDPLTLLAAFVLGTVATARATRLVTADEFPPVLYARLRWLTWTAQTPRREGWGPLVTCAFCASPYLAAGDLGLAYVSDLAPWWWWLNAWAAVSYAAAILVSRDEPPAE